MRGCLPPQDFPTTPQRVHTQRPLKKGLLFFLGGLTGGPTPPFPVARSPPSLGPPPGSMEAAPAACSGARALRCATSNLGTPWRFTRSQPNTPEDSCPRRQPRQFQASGRVPPAPHLFPHVEGAPFSSRGGLRGPWGLGGGCRAASGSVGLNWSATRGRGRRRRPKLSGRHRRFGLRSTDRSIGGRRVDRPSIGASIGC